MAVYRIKMFASTYTRFQDKQEKRRIRANAKKRMTPSEYRRWVTYHANDLYD